jgi:membrane protein
VSLVLGTIVAVLLLSAVAALVLGDDLLRSAGVTSPLVLWLRWPLALALLYSTIALLVGYAPVDRQEAHWVTFGSTVAVVAWAGTSAVLAWYLTSVADYGSAFGALATIVVTLTYLYVACAAFLTGTELDAMVRERVDGRVPGARATPLAA